MYVNINDSAQKKIDNIVKGSNGKMLLANSYNAIDFSFELAFDAGNELARRLQSHLSAAGLGSVSVGVGDVWIGDKFEFLNDVFVRVSINIDNVERPSLSPKSGGLDNVVVAFKTGWDIDPSKKRVSGIWHGNKTLNKLHRDPISGIVMDVVDSFDYPGVVSVSVDEKYQ